MKIVLMINIKKTLETFSGNRCRPICTQDKSCLLLLRIEDNSRKKRAPGTIHVDRVGITAFIKRFFTRTGINSLRAEKNHHFFLAC